MARKIIESRIWDKPPLYLKVWVFLLTQAQHSEYKKLKRGQVRTSIPDIIEGCKWHVGARIERPTKDQIYQILEWLRKPDEGGHESNAKATAITTTKATQGLLVTIDNYDFYQTFNNYESNAGSNDEKATKPSRKQRQPDNINKNDKNDKNDNKNTRHTKSYDEDSTYYKLAKYIYDKVMERAELLGLSHLVKDADLQKWSDTCRLILDNDKRDKQEVKKIIDWAVTDEFWQRNMLSPSSLRKHYVKLATAMFSSTSISNKPQKYSKYDEVTPRKVEML